MTVRDFQSVIGSDARNQFVSMDGGALPDHVVACGSNAMGLYSGFLDYPNVILHAVEPLGSSSDLGKHAATLTYGTSGTLYCAQSVVLQQADGLPARVSSVASGLVYPSVGPQIAMLHATGWLHVAGIIDQEVVGTFFRICRSEGIIPALGSCHALAFAMKLASKRPTSETILVNLSGRGDKDVDYILNTFGTGDAR